MVSYSTSNTHLNIATHSKDLQLVNPVLPIFPKRARILFRHKSRG